MPQPGERKRFANGNVGEWDGSGWRRVPADQVPQPISDREPDTWAGGAFKGFMEGSGKQLGTAAGIGAATALTGGLGFFPALAALTGGGVLGRLAGRKVTQAAGGKTEGTALDDAIAGGLEGAAGATAGPAVKLAGRALPSVSKFAGRLLPWPFNRAGDAIEDIGTAIAPTVQSVGDAINPAGVKRAFGNVPDLFESTSDDLAEQAARAAAGRGARMRSAAGMSGQSRPIPVSQAEHQAMQSLRGTSTKGTRFSEADSGASELDDLLSRIHGEADTVPRINPEGHGTLPADVRAYATQNKGGMASPSITEQGPPITDQLRATRSLVDDVASGLKRYGFASAYAKRLATEAAKDFTSPEDALAAILKAQGRR